MSTNLPITFEDKVNSAELLAYIQQFGEHTYLTAEEINQIRDAINELALPDIQIEISANSNVLNTWNGQTILFTANCTITVPASLNNSLMFPFRTLAGVTVTWQITSPFTWETTPTVTAEKTVGHFMRRGSTNTILLDF